MVIEEIPWFYKVVLYATLSQTLVDRLNIHVLKFLFFRTSNWELYSEGKLSSNWCKIFLKIAFIIFFCKSLKHKKNFSFLILKIHSQPILLVPRGWCTLYKFLRLILFFFAINSFCIANFQTSLFSHVIVSVYNFGSYISPVYKHYRNELVGPLYYSELIF